MDFSEWIKKHEGKDTPFGDLADDLKRDDGFPQNNDFEEIYSHVAGMVGFRMQGKVLKTFREAWAAYAKQCAVKIPSEACIEHTFCKKVEQLNGIAVKFTTPRWSGAPHCIVLLPGGAVKFVEFKALAAEPRALQKLRLVQLHNLGFECFIIDSMRDVDAFIEMVRYEIDSDSETRFENLEYGAVESVFRVPNMHLPMP